MNYISVCSGIEAASVAWHPLGWNCLGVSEIEPFPSAVLAHHYPSVPNFGDMTKFKEWKINGTVDLLVGGTPCQSFSVAGLRQGLKDPRGNLMLTYLAIAEHLRPRYIVWENVFGVLSSNGGKDFGSFLGGLGELGYGWAYRVLDAQWCRTHRHPRAVPQRRRRVFVVGCLGNPTSAAKILFKSESMQRYSAPRRATRQGTATDVAGCLRSGGDGGVPSSRGEHLVWPAQVASTLNASFGDKQGLEDQHALNGAPCFVAHIPKFAEPIYCGSNPNICDTVTSKWQKQSGGPAGSECGLFVLQPVAIPIMPQAMQSEGWRVGKENQDGRGNGLGVGKDGDPCPTLDRSAVPAVAFQSSGDRKNPSISFSSETSFCLPANPMSDRGQAVAIQGTVIGRQDHNGPQGSGHSDSGEMFTLNSTDVHAVAVGCFKSGQSAAARSLGFSETESPTLGASGGNGIPAVAIVNMQGSKSNACVTDDGSSYTINAMHGHDVHAVAVAPTITATNDPSRSPQSSEVTQQVAAIHASTMQVRRLTPTECERLQGFPDGWTAIPWKKKPADQCPDGPRYKALGNSMAVNCMEWLGERIQAVESGTL